jgi:plastocyanin
MRRAKLTGTLLTAAAITAAAVAGPVATGNAATAGAAGKKKVVKVKVADDFYSPTKVKIRKGSKVKWKWDSTNGNPHNVTLRKGPKKVKKKKFRSATGSVGIKFNRKFKKPGTYKFYCTIHPTTMQMTVKVKK